MTPTLTKDRYGFASVSGAAPCPEPPVLTNGAGARPVHRRPAQVEQITLDEWAAAVSETNSNGDGNLQRDDNSPPRS